MITLVVRVYRSSTVSLRIVARCYRWAMSVRACRCSGAAMLALRSPSSSAGPHTGGHRSPNRALPRDGLAPALGAVHARPTPKGHEHDARGR